MDVEGSGQERLWPVLCPALSSFLGWVGGHPPTSGAAGLTQASGPWRNVRGRGAIRGRRAVQIQAGLRLHWDCIAGPQHLSQGIHRPPLTKETGARWSAWHVVLGSDLQGVSHVRRKTQGLIQIRFHLGSITLHNCLSCRGMWRSHWFALPFRDLKLQWVNSFQGQEYCLVLPPLLSSLKAKTLEQMLLRFFQNVNKWPLEKEKIIAWKVFRENALFFRKLYMKENNKWDLGWKYLCNFITFSSWQYRNNADLSFCHFCFCDFGHIRN